MALTQIEKAVRNLLRQVIRDKGLEHVSSTEGSQRSNYVATISYAQSHNESTKYCGPLFFYYDVEGIVTCRAHTALGIVERHQFDINSPVFHEKVGELIDDYIPERNRKPADHKVLLNRSDKYVPDKTITIEKLGLMKRFKIYCKAVFEVICYGPTSYSSFYWENAISRYYNAKEEDVAIINQILEGMQTQSKKDITRCTTMVKNQKES